MYKIGLFVNIILLVYLFGCTHTDKSNVTVKKWYYENGNLKKLQEYVNDSIEQGNYMFYYPSGQLKDSAHITHGKFHGKRFEYHENGQLYGLTAYINNKYRNAITYRSDGTLEYYRAYNYAKNLMYVVWYDSLGKPIKCDGNPIYSWVLEKSYPIGEEFSIELLVADPPHCVTEVMVGDWDIKENTVLSKVKYTPDQFNRVNYSRKQNPEKDIYILHVANIHDTIMKKTITDTFVIMIDKEGKSLSARQLTSNFAKDTITVLQSM